MTMNKLTFFCFFVVLLTITCCVFGICSIPIIISMFIAPVIDSKYNPKKVGWLKSLAVIFLSMILITVIAVICLNIQYK